MRGVMTTHNHKGTRGLPCNYMIGVVQFTIFFNVLYVRMVFQIVLDLML